MALATILNSAAAAAAPEVGFLSSLGSIGSSASGIGSLISSLGGLFGGGNGPSSKKQIEFQLDRQYHYQKLAANEMPYWQVQGLRNAGLNPMLAVGKGISAPDSPRASMPTDDRMVSIQKHQMQINAASAMQALQLQNAQIELTRAQTAKTIAESDTEITRNENIAMNTKAQLSQSMLNETLQTKASNESLLVAQQEVAASLINQINKTGWLHEMKKQELRQMVNKTTVSTADAERARTDKEFFNSEIGKIMRTVRLVLQAIGL